MGEKVYFSVVIPTHNRKPISLCHKIWGVGTYLIPLLSLYLCVSVVKKEYDCIDYKPMLRCQNFMALNTSYIYLSTALF